MLQPGTELAIQCIVRCAMCHARRPALQAVHLVITDGPYCQLYLLASTFLPAVGFAAVELPASCGAIASRLVLLLYLDLRVRHS
jgi:hypothetical protein